MKVLEEFDISKYITTQDVVAAVTAGTIAYLTYKTKQDEPTPEQPQAAEPTANPTADPTIRVDHGRIDIQDPKLWKDGGVVNMNGNEIHVFKAPDGSTIRVNPYQLQAAGGDPMKAAMNQFADKVQNGQVDMDKLFAAGSNVRRGMTVDPLGSAPVATDLNLPTGGYAAKTLIGGMTQVQRTSTENLLAAQIYNASGKTIDMVSSKSAIWDVFDFADEHNMTEDGVRKLLNALGTKGIKKMIHLDNYSDDLSAVDNLLASVAKAAGVI